MFPEPGLDTQSGATVSNFIAIDLEPNGVYAVAGAARGSVKVTHAVAWTGADGEPPPALTLDTARAFGEALRAKLRAAGAPVAPVLVSIGRDRVILKELKHPPVPPREEPAIIKFQAIKEMSESPDDVVLDYVPLSNGAGFDPTAERRAMAVMLRKDVFNAVQAMCTAAGLKLAGVTPRPYAVAAGLTRAFAAGAAPAPEHKTDAVAALTLSPNGGEFTVVRSGETVLTLAIPSPVLANENMLVAQLRRNLTVYAGQHPGHPIQALYLAEVGPGWTARLASALGVPVHAYDPLAGALPNVPEHLRGRFAGAVGLLAGQAHGALPINFAAPRQPTTDRDPAKQRLVIAAIAAAVLLAGGAVFGYMMTNSADARVADLTRQRDDLKEKLEKGKPDTTRVTAIEGWSKREVVWLDELHDLANRMPADDSMRITSLSATPYPVVKDKQEAQSRMELKIAATDARPVNNLVSATERDNAPATKFYVNSPVSVLGTLPASAGKYTQGFGLVTKINHREPEKYTARPTFMPPKRSWGLFTPAPESSAELAPAPSEGKSAP